jgi:precorrin-3B methylase
MLQFGVAKELGMSLSAVRATMTAEELIGWSAYFQILNEDQKKELEKAKRRR